MEKEKLNYSKGFIIEERSDAMSGKFIITSKSIKYSKLELAWRICITAAIIALICLNV